jgi:hypothetical protein
VQLEAGRGAHLGHQRPHAEPDQLLGLIHRARLRAWL